MIYPTNFEQKIGFANVRQMLSDHCISQMGLERADKMAFSTNKAAILKSLEQTEEFIGLLHMTCVRPSTASRSTGPASTWRTSSP